MRERRAAECHAGAEQLGLQPCEVQWRVDANGRKGHAGGVRRRELGGTEGAEVGNDGLVPGAGLDFVRRARAAVRAEVLRADQADGV